ncbi:GNAT family N-acetyltransferase [Arthrobacter sp. MSA 4-2]|uniref:GNAT family N-acetyltransferase n=1 Tax=Arthrobacter sp. MSA 4-2 TaxID=2794349 RepID=UPI0018E8CF57|nr:GNAT family N-acetyltransferase [Arthrobacter sp. MSA 4-2]MBJ2119433.1 GNAT family N-acetyltransferase [Arthrobacter sp. MSA 4-2]
MDFFASDAFLTALARDYHRARMFEFKRYEVQGRQVRLAEVNGGRVLTTGPFFDYVKPLHPDGPPQRTLNFLPKLVTSVIALDDEDPAASVPPTTLEPAPLIVWGAFGTWEDYLALLGRRSKTLLYNRQRKLRRMLREQGEPVFAFDDPEPEALDLCVKWKIQQYEGGHETLEDPAAIAMLRGLFEDGHLILSTLRVADKYVAVQAGFVWQGEYLYLIPAYDPEFARHGVGRELLLCTLEHSFRQGHKSFDLLQGAEPYKWNFATHVQLIESLGQPPLGRRARAAAERVIKRRLLAVSPQLFYRAKQFFLSGRRRVKETTNRFRG